MKIIILGAGQVGSSVAENLAIEANDITVVDKDPERLRTLQEHFDLRTVLGYASHPNVLAQAGADDADMIVAVTNSDEANMVACQVAYHLFHTPTKIARVRASEYLGHKELFSSEAIPIDVLISPEQVVTDYIQRLIDTPGALQVHDFSSGRVHMVGVVAQDGSPLVNQELQNLAKHLPEVETRVAAIFRDGRALIPDGNTVINAGDEVFFITASQHILAVMGELKRQDRSVKRLIIAGGGNIGRRLAQALEGRYQVKLIERSVEVAQSLSEQLSDTLVLQGDAADEDLLREENIERTDIFCAVTNDDQVNILSTMLAKRMGTRKVMALINRGAYVDLVQSGTIDIAISPQQATIGTLLTHVRQGDVVVVHSLRRGAAEAIEAIAHGDRNNSQVVGRSVEEIELPPETTITALIRNEQLIIVHHDTIIEADDHVILFLLDKTRVPEVEKLFQVGVTFL